MIEKDFSELFYINQMTPMSDILSQVMFENNTELVEYIVRLLTRITNIRIAKVEVQKTFPATSAFRSARLDVYALDDQGNRYNIEIENNIKNANPDRALFYLSMIFSHSIKKGIKNIKLKPAYIIFITKEDYFNQGKPLYHFTISDNNLDLSLGKQTNIIYLNLKNKTDKRLLDFQHDFLCSDPNDMRVDVISRSVRYYKATKEGVSKMCEISRQIYKDGKADGIRIGKADGIRIGQIKSYADLINKKIITINQALSSLNMSIEDFLKYSNQYGITINLS